MPGTPPQRKRARKRVALVLGTRPEAIKLAPVLRALTAHDLFEPLVISTGQHREMLADLLPRLGVYPARDLAVMRDRQPLSALTARLVGGLGEALREDAPDAVVVQGDTTTAMAGALAAFYERIPVAHVEAGLRTGVMDDPFPEELSRTLIAPMARWHFAPTGGAAGNLRSEGVPAGRVHVTGNTVIDNLLWVLDRGLGTSAFTAASASTASASAAGPVRRVLVTLHRRENQGPTMAGIARALAELAGRPDVEIVLPLHKSPAVRESLLPVLGGLPRVRLVEPLDYFDFAATLRASDLVLTDSGGVQEEAPTLGKPVLVLRTTTERPEAVLAGAARLVGTRPRDILTMAAELLDDHVAYRRMATVTNPFGDGTASARIVRRLAADLTSGTAGASGPDTAVA
ncbi:non-hydrolyzing UDP-N-acetylglucosamine 2-epimerase [Spirillospora albida]|uniref:non-hydrolyzing UDP-N-acetylglucosamine 2-epimerase n=1 Tax=Spirillospora albida TaxID=58123 RepID=UPI00068D94C6|nr:UDP-N-acetylglucosamine 2-epimerase (non-hydrolyzing) [Spirillospora albida]